MGRRRKGLAITGWLAIDKPAGMTSTDVVTRVRRLTKAAKVGHGGTLDPLATGVLPIALGEATKTVSYVMDGAKSYVFRLKFGEATETDDTEGAVVETSEKRPTADEIKAVLPRFKGEIEQIPPIYSAVKVDGKRAYDLARRKEEVELKPRIVRVDDIYLETMPDGERADIHVVSGKGTYMRALARDIAKALGCVGHVETLRRLSCGPFCEGTAISLEKLEELGHSAPASEHMLPIETALDGVPAVALTESEARRLTNGQALFLMKLADRGALDDVEAGETVLAMRAGRLIALTRIEAGELKPQRIIKPDAAKE